MKLWVTAFAALMAASGAEAKQQKHHTVHKESAEPAAPARATDPNGAWSVEAKTSVGECPSLIPNSLKIAENKIESATGANVATWGYVDEEGNIVARFTDGGRVARFHGTLKGGRGSGAWSSSTDMCGGTWKAAQQ